MKKKIMAALLAGVMLLQQPVSGWCAQNTELTQKSEARQESESSEDTADGSEEDTEATGTAAADDGENSQEEDSEDVPTLQAETDEVTLDTGTSDNAPEAEDSGSYLRGKCGSVRYDARRGTGSAADPSG